MIALNNTERYYTAFTLVLASAVLAVRVAMRRLLIIVGALAAIVCIENPAKAQNGTWCAYYNTGDGGSRNCGFATFEQCLATVRGIGGNCSPSPYPSSPQAPTRYRRR